jgi:hypothetical protein
VERFGGKNLSTNIDIPIFKPGFDPEIHIQKCEQEWKKARYIDEIVWSAYVPKYIR